MTLTRKKWTRQSGANPTWSAPVASNNFYIYVEKRSLACFSFFPAPTTPKNEILNIDRLIFSDFFPLESNFYAYHWASGKYEITRLQGSLTNHVLPSEMTKPYDMYFTHICNMWILHRKTRRGVCVYNPVIVSRNSGLNGGQPKSCFGKPRAKSDAVSWTKSPMLSNHMSTLGLQLRGGEPPLL